MTNNPGLDARLEETWLILRDFDGPVTHLFIDGRNRTVTDRMRTAFQPASTFPKICAIHTTP